MELPNHRSSNALFFMKSFFLLSTTFLVASLAHAANIPAVKTSAAPTTKTTQTAPTRFAPATGTAQVGKPGKGISARDLRIRQQQMEQHAKAPVSSNHVSTQKKWPAMDLIIPEIGINAPIVYGIDDKTLRGGVGVDPLSSTPGERGNSVIAGHRNVWGAWFWDLPRLKPGSNVYVKTPKTLYTYRVAFSKVAQPHDTSLLEHPSDPKITRLTLYTCTKPKTECRFVVVANLVKKEPALVAKSLSTVATPKSTTKVSTSTSTPQN